MSILKREMRVALSKKAQPVWFRLVKWVVAIVVIASIRNSPWFWWYIGGGLAAGLAVHFLWRWKTKGWTQPWGGWNDLEAGSRDGHPHG